MSSSSSKKRKTVGRYYLVCKLGEGTYAKVFKGVDKDTNQEYALKCIQKVKLQAPSEDRGNRGSESAASQEQSVSHQNQAEKQLCIEISVMKSLSGHKHVLNLHEVLQTTNNIYLIMEIAGGGDLFKKIVPDVGIPEADARTYFQQLISALWFCHARHVAHRDIKPENLLFSSSGELKVADFGLSGIQKINEGGHVSYSLRLQTICGTPNYVAPEVISDETMGYDGFKADIWSCGVVLYHMLCGHLPFRGPGVRDVLRRITFEDPEKSDKVSHDALDLILIMLMKDPVQRGSLRSIVKHPWFAAGFDYDDLDEENAPP